MLSARICASRQVRRLLIRRKATEPTSLAVAGNSTVGAQAGTVNGMFVPDPYVAPELAKKDNQLDISKINPAHWNDMWDDDRIEKARAAHVVATWGPTSAIKNVPLLERGTSHRI